MPRDMKYAGLGLMEFPTNRWLTPSPDRSGHHRMDGILFITGPGIRRGYPLQGASIMDIAPTTLALMDVPIPADMDGRVLEAAMTPQLRQQVSIRYSDTPTAAAPELVWVGEMSDEDEDIIRTRLQDLGSLGETQTQGHGRPCPYFASTKMGSTPMCSAAGLAVAVAPVRSVTVTWEAAMGRRTLFDVVPHRTYTSPPLLLPNL